MDSDKTAIMLLREIHASIYGNGRAGLLERVTRLEARAERTPKLKNRVLKFSVGSGAITSLSHFAHLPELTYAGIGVSVISAIIWFMLEKVTD